MKNNILLLMFVIICVSYNTEALQNLSIEETVTMKKYYFPSEDEQHEGTWLNWPHHYTYGKNYRNEIENIWIEMTYALYSDEKVHIIAYNEKEKKCIINILKSFIALIIFA